MSKLVAMPWVEERELLVRRTYSTKAGFMVAQIGPKQKTNGQSHCVIWAVHPAYTFYAPNIGYGQRKIDEKLIEFGWKLIGPDKLGVLL